MSELEKERFTRDAEPPTYEIYDDCARCGKRVNIDELEEGVCAPCHQKYEDEQCS